MGVLTLTRCDFSRRGATLAIQYSVWARTTKRGVSLPVSGQRLIMFFGKLIMSRTHNDVIAVWIL